MIQNKSIDTIKANALFLGLRDADVIFTLKSENFIGKREGDIIYKNGDETEFIYLVIEGEIKLKIPGLSRGAVVVHKNKNEFFGEKEFIEKSNRTSSAVANTDCILYALDRGTIYGLASVNKAILENINKFNEWLLQTGAQFPGIKRKRLELLDFASKTIKLNDLLLPDTNDIELLNTSIAEQSVKNTEDEDVNQPIEGGEDTIDEPFNATPTDTPTEKPVEEPHNISYEESFEILEDPLQLNSDESNNYQEELIQEITEPVQEIPDEDAALLNKEKQYLSIISALEKIVHGIDRKEILESITEVLKELTGADICLLYLVNEEKNELCCTVNTNGKSIDIILKFDSGIEGRAAVDKEIINIPDTTADPNFTPEYDKITGYKTNNFLCYPVINNEKVLAVIQLLNNLDGAFSKDNEESLSLFSPGIVHALEKITAIEELQVNSLLSSLNKTADFILPDIENNILTIKHYGEYIKKQEASDNIKKVIDVQMKIADSTNDFIKITSNFAKGNLNLQLTEQDFRRALSDTLSLLAEYVETRNIKLFKKIESDSNVMLDSKAFYQACFQIAKNACMAMPGGGNIYITAKKEDDNMRIDFKDSGNGIPESIIGSILEPFVSHWKDGGTGLGLAIVNKIIKEHGGKILVKSVPGEGSLFSILLPVTNR